MAGSRRYTTAALLCLLAICGTIAHFRRSIHPEAAPPPSEIEPELTQHRRLSVGLPNGGCQITWPQKPTPDTQITYAASYPGCGARMTWNLVEALTGLWTGDDWNNNGRGRDVVTVKTHYPQSNGILVEFDEDISRGFIVIRNPLKSIPSFFNHIYEMRNHLPVHSKRAPVDEWIKWRDHYLEEEIREYKKFIIYWMDRFPPEKRYLITYEGLIDDLIGAEVAKGLNDFLGQAHGVTPVDREAVQCIWRVVVKNEKPTIPPGPPPDYIINGPNGGASAAAVVVNPVPPAAVGAVPAGGIPPPYSANLGPPYSAPGAVGAVPVYNANSAYLNVPANSAYVNVPPAAYPPAVYSTNTQPLGGFQPNNNLRRRLDPGHHDSQRQGPEEPRPYTPQQLDTMMEMLLSVGERYKDDVRLYHIMMGYYEKVRAARIAVTPGDVVEPPGGFY